MNTQVETTNAEQMDTPKKKLGFAVMSVEQRRAISSKGGKAAHEKGTAHQFNSEEARLAGRKGGIAPHVRRGRVPRD